MSGLASRLWSIFSSGSSRQDVSVRVDRVAPWLHIGPVLRSDGYAALRNEGVTHVIDLREEASDDEAAIASLGLRWRRYPVRDGQPPTHQQLEAMIAWLDAEADAGVDQVLFVHCRYGVTRAPTVAVALLLHHRLTLTLAEAHRRVFAARPEMMPTAAQLAWLGEVEARVRKGGDSA